MPAASKLVYALHGFLGSAQDWQTIAQGLTEDVAFYAESLFTPASAPIQNLEVTTDGLSERVRERFAGASSKKVFLGYSLGGRLGLHLLKHRPDLFDHYIFLSTNPGLPDAAVADRKQRLEHDRQWAQKLTQPNWQEFLAAWNAQSVFSGSGQEPRRSISDYDLEKLQQALVLWSLAKQSDMSEVICQQQKRITWCVGKHDHKYVQLAQNMRDKGYVDNFLELEGGHRLWLDAPEAVTRIIQNI